MQLSRRSLICRCILSYPHFSYSNKLISAIQIRSLGIVDELVRESVSLAESALRYEKLRGSVRVNSLNALVQDLDRSRR